MRVRKGVLPRVMAAFANLAITILRLPKTANLKRRTDQLRMRPDEAMAILGAC